VLIGNTSIWSQVCLFTEMGKELARPGRVEVVSSTA